MGFWDSLGTGLVAGPLGLTGLLLPEDTRAKIPVLNSLTGSESNEQKALVARQEAMAADMKKRQAANEQARLNAMGQRLAAFNPQNQMMARMFGPEAAFTPQQFAQMAADPYAKTPEQIANELNPIDPTTGARKYRSGQIPLTSDQQAQLQADRTRAAQNQARIQQIQQQMTPVGPGPAPIQQRAPQAARRY